jgi:lipopolysaccharide export system permease protein
MGWILYRYIVREQVVPAAICFFGLVMVLVAGRLMQLTSYLFSSSITWFDLLAIMGLAVPKLMLYALPMATLLGTLLAFLRLNNDNELTALKVAGLGFRQFAPAVLTVALVTTLLSFYTSLWLVPTANLEFREKLASMGKAVLPALLREGMFIDAIPNLVFFFKRVEPESFRIKGVFIHDGRDPQLSASIVAKRAQILNYSTRNTLVLQAADGVITRVGRDLTDAQAVAFEDYQFVLPLDQLFRESKSQRRDEMTLEELFAAYDATGDARYAMEAHIRFSLPVACLLLAMAAAPLGALFQRGNRLTGVSLGIALFLAYYVVLSAGKGLGEQAVIPPWLAVWLPNLAAFALAAALWTKTHRETPFTRLPSLAEQLKRRVRRTR